MNLYLVTQDEMKGYDTYDSFVCVAASEDEARWLHPFYGHEFVWDDPDNLYYSSWCAEPEHAKVTLLGVADSKYTEAQVILASFNAG